MSICTTLAEMVLSRYSNAGNSRRIHSLEVKAKTINRPQGASGTAVALLNLGLSLCIALRASYLRVYTGAGIVAVRLVRPVTCDLSSRKTAILDCP